MCYPSHFVRLIKMPNLSSSCNVWQKNNLEQYLSLTIVTPACCRSSSLCCSRYSILETNFYVILKDLVHVWTLLMASSLIYVGKKNDCTGHHCRLQVLKRGKKMNIHQIKGTQELQFFHKGELRMICTTNFFLILQQNLVGKLWRSWQHGK